MALLEVKDRQVSFVTRMGTSRVTLPSALGQPTSPPRIHLPPPMAM